MNWYDWFVAAFFAFGALMTVSMVGKERKPTTPGVAAWVVAIDAALIAGLLVTR